MAFLSHRCRRCGHPEYWAQEATRAGTAPRAFPVQGKAFDNVGMSRAWCRECPRCKDTGCDYDPASYVVDQWTTLGEAIDVLFEPGIEVNGVSAPAGKTYACPCDGCRRIWEAWADGRDASGNYYN